VEPQLEAPWSVHMLRGFVPMSAGTHVPASPVAVQV
jgi:hypothetical protein